MAELLDNIHAELRARLQELRPLTVQYERLEAALAALTSAHGHGTAERSTPTRARRTPSRKRARRRPVKRRAPRGQNKALIFKLIKSTPGATVSAIQAATGIDKPIIYNITREGIEDGDLDRVLLAGGIQGFKTKQAAEAAERSKPAASGSRRPAKSTSKSTPEPTENAPRSDDRASERDKPAG